MFPGRFVALIGDYIGVAVGDPAWLDVVEFLKRDAGDTKDGSVSFPEALIDMLGERETGAAQIADLRESIAPPDGLMYRQVVRVEYAPPYDHMFLVPRGVRLRENNEIEGVDGQSVSLKWGAMRIEGVTEVVQNSGDINTDQLKWATHSELEIINEHHDYWSDLVEKGEQYDVDPDYKEEKPDDGRVGLVCLRCEVPCAVMKNCEGCGEDMCEMCEADDNGFRCSCMEEVNHCHRPDVPYPFLFLGSR